MNSLGWRTRELAGWWFGLVALVAVPVLLHHELIEQPSLSGDDNHYLLQSALASQAPATLLSPRYHGPRPVTDVAYWLIYEVAGQNEAAYRVVILLCHGLVAAGFAALTRLLGLHPITAIVAGLLYVVSPSHFRNVHVIASLSYHLALLLVIAATAAWVHWQRHRGALAASGFVLLAPMAVLAHPAAIFAVPFWFGRNWRLGRRWWSGAPVWAAAALSLACLASLALVFPNKIQSYHSLRPVTVDELFMQLLLLLGRLASTAFWLPMPVWQPHTWELAAGAGVLVGLAVLIWRRQQAADWAIWILLAMAPFLSRLPRSLEFSPAPTPTGPSHYMHMAALGLAALGALGLEWLLRRTGGRKGVVVATAAGLLLLFGSLQAHQHLTAFAFYAAGRQAAETNRSDVADRALRIALQRGTDDRAIEGASAVYWLVRNGMRSRPDALAAVDEGLAMCPQCPELHVLRLAALSMTAPAEALDGYQREIEVLLQGGDGERLRKVAWTGFGDLALPALEAEDPTRVARAFTLQQRYAAGQEKAQESMLELGIAQLESEDLQAAETTLRRLLRVNPDHAPAHHNLAAVYLRRGQLDSAATHLRSALQTQADPLSSYTLAQVLLRRGELGEAQSLLFDILPAPGRISRRRLQLEAQYGGLRVEEVAHCFELLGQISHELGDYAGAVHAYRAAIAIHGDDAVNATAQLEINLALAAQQGDGAPSP